ncbi:MAG: pyruvate kinase, partial [Pseudomonadota bacterium]
MSKMRRLRRVKILATLGPASQDPAVVKKLVQAGVDVFRINMSHTSHDMLQERVQTIRALEKEIGHPIGILADLQGPKLRVGQFADGGVDLPSGAHFILDADKAPGDHTRVHLPHPEILSALRPGHTVLIDDGKVRLHVSEVSKGRAVCVVDVAGRISNRKGVSLPDTEIPV